MPPIKRFIDALVGPAPIYADDPVRQGSVIFKQGDLTSDKAVKAAIDAGEPGIINRDTNVKLKGEVYINGKPPRESWLVSGPKATVIALSKEAVEPLIKALCAANGDDPDDYTSTKSTIWIDMSESVVPFPGLDE